VELQGHERCNVIAGSGFHPSDKVINNGIAGAIMEAPEGHREKREGSTCGKTLFSTWKGRLWDRLRQEKRQKLAMKKKNERKRRKELS